MNDTLYSKWGSCLGGPATAFPHLLSRLPAFPRSATIGFQGKPMNLPGRALWQFRSEENSFRDFVVCEPGYRSSVVALPGLNLKSLT